MPSEPHPNGCSVAPVCPTLTRETSCAATARGCTWRWASSTKAMPKEVITDRYHYSGSRGAASLWSSPCSSHAATRNDCSSSWWWASPSGGQLPVEVGGFLDRGQRVLPPLQLAQPDRCRVRADLGRCRFRAPGPPPRMGCLPRSPPGRGRARGHPGCPGWPARYATSPASPGRGPSPGLGTLAPSSISSASAIRTSPRRSAPGAPATDGNSNPNRYVPPTALAPRTDSGSCTNPRHGPACSAPEAGPGFREDELAGGGQVWPCSTCSLLLWMRAT